VKIIAETIEKSFKLLTDPEEKAEVSFRQATFGEDIARQEMFAKRTQVFTDGDDGEYRVEQAYNQLDIHVREIFLTLSAATGFVDKVGNEVFRFKDYEGKHGLDMNEAEFRKHLLRMTTEQVNEMHKRMLEVNPQWDPNRKGE